MGCRSCLLEHGLPRWPTRGAGSAARVRRRPAALKTRGNRTRRRRAVRLSQAAQGPLRLAPVPEWRMAATHRGPGEGGSLRGAAARTPPWQRRLRQEPTPSGTCLYRTLHPPLFALGAACSPKARSQNTNLPRAEPAFARSPRHSVQGRSAFEHVHARAFGHRHRIGTAAFLWQRFPAFV
jgi:hypothetical protein